VTQRVVAIVQARMTSSRLPGKVLREVLGRPLLSYQLERMRRAAGLDEIVIATTTNATDDAIVSFCRRESCAVVRGSEDDVLGRYALAAREYPADTIVRMTSDCPLIDPEVIELALRRFGESGCDYLSNMMQPTWPYGLAVEVMKSEVLRAAAAEARDPREREHVTPFIYWRPDRFRLESLTSSPDRSHLRWTVDTPDDFELAGRILEELYPVNPNFVTKDVLALLEAHPDWAKINAHVKQRTAAGTAKDDR
jgi:spore coat polysaccharide biosynthesis protein SpsF